MGIEEPRNVMKPEPHLPEGAITLTSYADLDRYVKAFAGGAFNLLILLGAPGLQKSRVARDALPDACWIECHATALGMYQRLWEFRDEPVVIDDVDSLYANRAAVRLLKALCQTDGRKTIAWESDAPALQRGGIPRRFSTSSRVLIIANDWRTLNVNVTALEDRGHLLFFLPTPLEVHRRTAEWFWDQEVFDWIGANLHLISRPSMRLYHAAWEQKQAGLEWRENILARWLSGPRLLAAQLRSDPRFATEEDRARAFEERGGGCRATYFNHARHIRPPAEPPRIVLTNAPPARAAPFDLLELLRRRQGEPGKG
jgi:hypothetical protein